MKKILMVVALSFCLAWPCASAQAASQLQVVAEDGMWGALIGGLIGTASLAFRDHPSDHAEIIYQGTAIGLVGGVLFGIYEISPVFYSYRDPVTKDTTYALAVRVPLR